MDDVITLIGESVVSYDEHGNEIQTARERTVMCRIYGVTRNEFYQAAVADMHPEITARLSDFMDYQGEQLARYNGVLYSVIRTYRDGGSYHHKGLSNRQGGGFDPNAIELILERKIGNGKERQTEQMGGGADGCSC